MLNLPPKAQRGVCIAETGYQLTGGQGLFPVTVTTLQGHVQDHQGEKKIGRTVQVEEDTAGTIYLNSTLHFYLSLFR